jgi:hypothetical protein
VLFQLLEHGFDLGVIQLLFGIVHCFPHTPNFRCRVTQMVNLFLSVVMPDGRQLRHYFKQYQSEVVPRVGETIAISYRRLRVKEVEYSWDTSETRVDLTCDLLPNEPPND